MKRYPFTKPAFVKTAMKQKDWPLLKDLSGHVLPEIAVAGRSNVGKSTLLNHLFKVKDLVKTSSVPGKTQGLNFFTLNQRLAFCDLPGYGYAKVPDTVRKAWGPMIQEYLEKREELKLILFLLDIRRIPNEDDINFLNWASHFNKSVIVVITKIDKVTKQECINNFKLIKESFPFENLHYVQYSVPLNTGRDGLINLIHEALQSEESQQEEVIDGFN